MLKVSSDRLAMANEVVQREVVALSELAQAERIVLKEKIKVIIFFIIVLTLFFIKSLKRVKQINVSF